jgi:hypothetical protein
LGYVGGTGWKQRSPYNAIITHQQEGKSQEDKETPKDPLVKELLAKENGSWSTDVFDAGFYTAGYTVLVDTKRQLVWFSGDERLKGVDYTTSDTKVYCTLHFANVD